MSQGRRRQKNPLYVVTNSGKDVESARGAIDALLKKTGLSPFVEPLMKLFVEWLKGLLESVNSYANLVVVNQLITHWVRQFELLMASLGLGPVVPHPDNQ